MPLVRMKTKSFIKNIHFLRILRIFFVAAGILFLVMIILAFTTLPFWGIHWLGTSKTEFKGEPGTIILLGGGGMPSESNLMRSWFTEKAARSYPAARVLIAMPGDTADHKSTPRLVEEELLIRGLERNRIFFENQGTNTRAQALFCSEMLNSSETILLVTSPEHTRRAVLCFQKTGFRTVYALPAFEHATEADLTYKDKDLGGRKIITPDVGESTSVRYQVWNHLKYEIIFARELAATVYYKLRGWI